MNFVPKMYKPLLLSIVLFTISASGFAMSTVQTSPIGPPEPPPPPTAPPGVPVDGALIVLFIASIALGYYYLSVKNKKARV